MYRADAPMGYFALTPAEVLWRCLEKVKSLDNATIDKAYNQMFIAAFQRPNYLIQRINILQLASMATTYAIEDGARVYQEAMTALEQSPGLTQERALTMILAMYLKFQDRVDEVPQMLAYRTDPSMSMDELALLLMNEGLENVGIPLPPPRVNMLPVDLRQAMIYYIRALKQHFSVYPTAKIKIIRAYAHDIAYRLENAIIAPTALTQWDRSFIAHLMSEQYGLTSDEITEGYRFELLPGEYKEDRAVVDTVDKLKKFALEGPKTRFLATFSNGTPEDLVNYIGPYAPQMMSAVGFLWPIGGFDEITTQVYDIKPWDKDAHIQAVMEEMRPLIVSQPSRPGDEAIGGFLASEKASEISRELKVSLALRNDRGPAGTKPVPMIMDNPEIIWEYESMRATLGPYADMTVGRITQNYYSHWRRRMINNVWNLNEWILDKVLTSTKLGNGAESPSTELSETPSQFGLLTLDKFRFCMLGPNAASRVKPLKTAMSVMFLRGNQVRTHEGDFFKPYFAGVGDRVVMPAFNEYYRPKLEDFLIENTQLENRVKSKLGLTHIERKRSEIGIRVSVNLWKAKELFGIPVPQEAGIRQLAARLMRGH